MQSLERIKKIKEAKRLLSGEPEPQSHKIWFVSIKNGVETCKTMGYPDEVNDRDLVIRFKHF